MRRSFRQAFALLPFSLISLFLAPNVALATCCRCETVSVQGYLCLQTTATCDTIKTAVLNPNLANVKCSAQLDDQACQPKDNGGACTEVANAETYGSTVGTKEPTTHIPIEPNVPIPGLTFPTEVPAGGGVAQTPYLALYIQAAYNYLIGVSIIAAAIMIIYGGFRYILGSTAGSVSRGKEIIWDALIGLILILGTYTIVSVVNPTIANPSILNVDLTSLQAFSSPSAEVNRVTAASTVPAPTTGKPAQVVVPGETPPSPQPSSTPTPPSPGTVVKDQNGNLIAQTCPSDMVPVPYSSAYETHEAKAHATSAHVNSFCMDKFEAPNQAGVKPFNGVTEIEAEWYCSSQGKRLCTSNEWTRACLGPEGTNTYGYGPDYVKGQAWVSNVKKGGPGGYIKTISKDMSRQPAPCNYDQYVRSLVTWSKLHSMLDFYALEEYNPLESILAHPDFDAYIQQKIDAANGGGNASLGTKLSHIKSEYDTMRKEAGDKWSQYVIPSGSRPTCVTPEGVYDLNGNVTEITVKDADAKKTSQQRINETLSSLKSSSCIQNNRWVCGKDWSWRGYYFNPLFHLGDPGTQPTCYASSGGPHAPIGFRSYEIGFRCCMDLQPADTGSASP